MARFRRERKKDGAAPALTHKDARLLLGQQGDGTDLSDQPYDRRRLSYATTFTNPVKQKIIQAMELLTAKYHLLRRIRRFEAMGVPHGQPFWAQALNEICLLYTSDAADE